MLLRMMRREVKLAVKYDGGQDLRALEKRWEFAPR
jgi:hypothetical protein